MTSMDHPEPHPSAGRDVFLSLKSADPTRRIYSGMAVNVLDWADRHSGTPWASLVAEAGEPRVYRRRLARSGTDLRDSEDVVAVTAIGQPDMILVHHSEIRPPREEAQDG